MRETGKLLQEMYLLAHAQVVLGKDDLELAIDWPALRMRFEEALIRDGVPVPPLPEGPIPLGARESEE